MRAKLTILALLASALVVLGLSSTHAATGCLESGTALWERSDWDRGFPQGHQFGSEVVIHDEMAIVGEPGIEFPHPSYVWQGRVHIYRRVCSRWIPEQILEPNVAAEKSLFGKAIATDGVRIVVGAPHFSTDLGDHVGAVWVYDFNGTIWQPTGPIFVPDDPEAGDKFGYSVAINGDWLFVGAPFRAETAHLSGAVFVFRFVDGQWRHHVSSSPIVSESDVQDDVRFGMSLATDDDLLVIGAPNDSYEALRRGSVAVHRLEGSDWIHEERLVIPGNAVFAGFGESVDVDNGLVAVGAPYSGFPQSGSAWTFVFDSKQWQWGAASELTTSLPLSSGRAYGRSVSISGQTILVGAPGQSVCSVQEFSNGNWIEAFITPDECEGQLFFGESVSINGDYVAIGAPNVSTSSGTINFYSISDVAHDLTLEGWSVIWGTWQGDLLRLQCTDNLRLQGTATATGTFNTPQLAAITAWTTAPAVVDRLHLTIEASHPMSPTSGVVGCQVQLRNWGTGNFENLSDFVVPLVDLPEYLFKLNCIPAGSYVRSSDRRVEVRLRFRYTLLLSLFNVEPFQVDVDLIEIRASYDE